LFFIFIFPVSILLVCESEYLDFVTCSFFFYEMIIWWSCWLWLDLDTINLNT